MTASNALNCDHRRQMRRVQTVRKSARILVFAAQIRIEETKNSNRLIAITQIARWFN